MQPGWHERIAGALREMKFTLEQVRPTISRLALKPHVVFPAFYYAIQYGLTSSLTTVTVVPFLQQRVQIGHSPD